MEEFDIEEEPCNYVMQHKKDKQLKLEGNEKSEYRSKYGVPNMAFQIWRAKAKAKPKVSKVFFSLRSRNFFFPHDKITVNFFFSHRHSTTPSQHFIFHF